jgi:hypothetical protein
MQPLIVTGSVLAVAGIALLGWSVRLALQIRRNPTEDDAANRAALTRVMYWNMGGLGLAMLGLMTVLVAVVLT